MTGGTLGAELSGTGRLGDDLYLMAHNDRTGRPYLQPRAAGIGLAGALLAELLLAGGISLSSDGTLSASAATPADQLTGQIQNQILGERELLPAREWLQFLSRTTVNDVARRLAGAGYLTRIPRRPWRAGLWVPADSDCAFMPLTRARSALDSARMPAIHAAALAGLAAACGLETRLLAYAPPPRGRRSPQEAAALLPIPLRELVAVTQATVDSAVLAQQV
jgi:Golgi phosphoprotein 3 (GPP34)